MTQIVEFVTENSIWFLSGIIVISLAVIGYYAEKTNFGQGKNLQTEKDKEVRNLDNMRLQDVLESDVHNDDYITSAKNTKLEEINEIGVETQQSKYPVDSIQEISIPKGFVSENDSLTNVEEINNGFIDNYNSFEGNNDHISSKKTTNDISLKNMSEESLLIEENFNRFNAEFNSVLPKEQLISDDLLSDIDDLELWKTQRIDLTEVPDLDDIELPKIKQIGQEEQDIWKF